MDGANAIGAYYDGSTTNINGDTANSNVLRNCRIIPSSSDGTQTGVYVNAYGIELDRAGIEHAAGNGILLGKGATSNRPTHIIALP